MSPFRDIPILTSVVFLDPHTFTLLSISAPASGHSPSPRNCRPPPRCARELRPYQRAGYGWLRALSDRGFGGMLADDMGLGKTLQALALLAHRHLEEKTDRPSFVVVPTAAT